MKKCPWTECWWGAIVVPGYCVKGGDMQNKDCPLFLSEEAQWGIKEVKDERDTIEYVGK